MRTQAVALNSMNGVAPNAVEKSHADNRRDSLLYGNCRPQI